jgi:hypothetical protein
MVANPMHVLLILGLGTLLSACAEDPFRPLADALLQPATVQSGTSVQSATTVAATSKTPREICPQVAMSVPVDVDTVYARIQSAFHYKSWEERKHIEDNGGMWVDNGFKHEAQPGAYYKMADWVGITYSGKEKGIWLDTQLAKDGPSKTRLKATYCISERDPSFSDPQFSPYIEKLIHNSVL